MGWIQFMELNGILTKGIEWDGILSGILSGLCLGFNWILVELNMIFHGIEWETFNITVLGESNGLQPRSLGIFFGIYDEIF